MAVVAELVGDGGGGYGGGAIGGGEGGCGESGCDEGGGEGDEANRAGAEAGAGVWAGVGWCLS